MTSIIWAGFFFGLAGSTHCVGMCGPIALLIPVKGRKQWPLFLEILQYNLGRIAMYILLGLLIGTLNKGMWLIGIQNQLSIGIGIVLLLSAVLNLIQYRSNINIFEYTPLLAWVKKQINRLLVSRKPYRLVLLGWLNGLLPCGLVYLALTGAFATSNLLESGLYMGAFGVGTLPLMLLVSMGGKLLSPKLRTWINKLTPILLILMGFYFIYRGLKIEMPSSYRLGTSINEEIEMCH